MPKYYFPIITGGQIAPDDEGMELPNLLAALAEAHASVCDIARSGSSKERCAVDILDAAGRTLESVPVHFN